MNKVILIGNLGKDPEIRYTKSDKAVGNFSLATTERWGGEPKTEWHQIVVWDKLAEIAGQYLSKGKKVAIEGRIQTRQWEDNDGVKRYMTEIVANNFEMLGSKADGGLND
jgi:single-strand DNA-binding protein